MHMRPMRWFRNLTALVLLGFWLPATLHCDLEASGLLDGFLCCSTNDGCAQDDCATVESGHFKSGTGVLKVPVPLETLQRPDEAAFSPESWRDPAPAGSPRAFGATVNDWLPHWRFAQRAAPLPGAPAIH